MKNFETGDVVMENKETKKITDSEILMKAKEIIDLMEGIGSKQQLDILRIAAETVRMKFSEFIS